MHVNLFFIELGAFLQTRRYKIKFNKSLMNSMNRRSRNAFYIIHAHVFPKVHVLFSCPIIAIIYIISWERIISCDKKGRGILHNMLHLYSNVALTDKVKHVMSNQHDMFNVSNTDYSQNNAPGGRPL